MKVALIKPLVLQEEERIEVLEIENNLESLKSLVCGEIEIIPCEYIEDDYYFILNKNGKTDDLAPTLNFFFDVLVGNIIFVKRKNTSDFESIEEDIIPVLKDFVSQKYIDPKTFFTDDYFLYDLRRTLKHVPKFNTCRDIKNIDKVIYCAYVKLWNDNRTWYLCEYDSDKDMGYGLVIDDNPSFREFSIKELENLGAERLIYSFSYPNTFGNIINKELKNNLYEDEIKNLFYSKN